MWSVVASLEVVWQGLAGVFTHPSFVTHQQVFIGWVMCLGRRSEFRVFEAIGGQRVCRRQRHPFDRFYNFFCRSAWTTRELAHRVAVSLVTQLDVRGELRLLVDATLLHKSGKHVWAIGWFHDPVASTKKRAATALGNKWVVIGLAVQIPGIEKTFCLPIHAMLLNPAERKCGEARLARKMLEDILSWFPEREILLVGDGNYSANTLLSNLDPRVRYVGLMRGDAALHDPKIPRRRKSKPGPRPSKGPRLPSPRNAAAKADRSKSRRSRWRWTSTTLQAYGEQRRYKLCAFQAVWPKVFGNRTIQVVLCRCLDAGYGEVYLYTTDLSASPEWVVQTYARRTSIEALFKSSKQVMGIQQPQHWCKQSVEKLAPWVWLMQSLVALWYLSEGRHLPAGLAARKELGEWETEWSFSHMLRLLRRVTILEEIKARSATKRDLAKLAQRLENYLYLAA